MRRKIAERVKDPRIAERLIPTNHGFGTWRVPLESGYYEVYNQPNVRLVDLRETPIERITTAGVKTKGCLLERRLRDNSKRVGGLAVSGIEASLRTPISDEAGRESGGCPVNRLVTASTRTV